MLLEAGGVSLAEVMEVLDQRMREGGLGEKASRKRPNKPPANRMLHDQRQSDVSPYRRFTSSEWAKLRADTPLTLSAEELEELRGLNDRVDLDEVVAIYLPLSRLLNLYVAATQKLFRATQKFLGGDHGKVPYIIGMAGSVAAGKSTTARILRHLLARWPNHPKVDLVTTDGFLLPNSVLNREGLLNRKGFPESYDLPALLRFLSAIKAGRGSVSAPVYSHLFYDVLRASASSSTIPTS